MIIFVNLDVRIISYFHMTYPHVHISQMHFSLCFLSIVFEDDFVMAKSSFAAADVLDVEVDVTLVFILD